MNPRDKSDSTGRGGVFGTLSGMNVSPEKRSWLAPLVHLAYNPLTFVGLFLVNTAAVIWLFVLPVVVREGALHPYLNIFFLGLLPLAFVAGAVLVPLGIYLRYRGERKREVPAREYAPLGWDNREFRNMAGFVVIVTGLNVLVGGYFSQATVHYMDSSRFCGTTCHSMTPEFTAYQSSPHVNIECVECHIGSGRRAYVGAKLNGLSQVWHTTFNSFTRPIPTPLHRLRPAWEICETCHWPENFGGVSLQVLDKFAPDSANTHTKSVVALRIGGGPIKTGIHGFHASPQVRIEYVADASRLNISWVRYTDSTGTATEFAKDTWDPDSDSVGERRTMDCLDCHTRPSHRFQMPQRALDQALALGTVDTLLPYIKRDGLRILQAEYSTTEEAVERIPAALVRFYRTQHPETYDAMRDAVERSAQGLTAIYTRNVFPEMNVGWGTYPDHIGHSDFVGCFRCHAGYLKSADGTAITSSCTACHQILAFNEPEAQLLERFGIR